MYIQSPIGGISQAWHISCVHFFAATHLISLIKNRKISSLPVRAQSADLLSCDKSRTWQAGPITSWGDLASYCKWGEPLISQVFGRAFQPRINFHDVWKRPVSIRNNAGILVQCERGSSFACGCFPFVCRISWRWVTRACVKVWSFPEGVLDYGVSGLNKVFPTWHEWLHWHLSQTSNVLWWASE